MPSFKSIADFALLTYVHAIYEIDPPFVNGLKEFDDIRFLSKLLRKNGGYFIDVNHLQNELYQIVLEELLGSMMKKRLMMAYHLERRRSRSGKIK